MARTSDPTYITHGKRGRGIGLQIPIVHPAFCVCRSCAERPAEERSEPCVVRIRRQAKAATEHRAIAEAQTLKSEIESALVAGVNAAMTARRAIAGASFLDLANLYARYEQEHGRRYDRDKYVLKELVAFFGASTDPAMLQKKDVRRYQEHLAAEGRAPATIARRLTTLIALLNVGVDEDLIGAHQLHGLRKPKVVLPGPPQTFSSQQVAVLLGPAMDRFEAEQRSALAAFDPRSGQRPPTAVPLRGFCLIAYLTLMRPSNLFTLQWEDVVLSETDDSGSFHLTKHKNASRIGAVEGALHPAVVRYLRSIRPADTAGWIHPNPSTGRPYVNIRAAWARLIAIANEILAPLGPREQLSGRRTNFYTWRHSGASAYAAAGVDAVAICRLMGDTVISTVYRHYFASPLEHQRAAIPKLSVPVDAEKRADTPRASGGRVPAAPNRLPHTRSRASRR